MASICKAVATRCIKIACFEGEWFGYTSVSCIDEEDYQNDDGHSSYKEGDDDDDEEDYHNGDRDLYREGDDDDDGGYDYAPAA
ncbi:hypothetical protein P8452_54983 [Trifolium repens]|nr:hypothetical protein P8452_54983 [Trifolium repens]